MKAAVITDFNQPPVIGEIADLILQPGEQRVSPRATAISQLVRAKASGLHYSSGTALPMVPGVDGVGLLENGDRVFFVFPRDGSMAEQAAVRSALCVPIPDDLDDISAAALANPGMSSIAALQYRASFNVGETVLINGAAGASGRLAIQIARYLGASTIIATARNPDDANALLALGADQFISLNQSAEQLTATFRDLLETSPVDIVLDYLWGIPAACLLKAIPALPDKPLRYVNIGSMAGADLPFDAGTLRSKNLVLMGSGIGSVATGNLIKSISQVFEWAQPAGLKINTKAMTLDQVTQAWQYTGSERLVLTIG
ncbi:quinone oxidoreductase family protein [Amphritea sp.]|uniref:quinone oxidoreductase family protein n=1 Tax=Amphritea sp. TaxID=1872502 RepID=UPI003D121B3D